ncbi:energy-coupling factor transporter transmembrane component T family protein [Actinosynnema sp. NPDC059335]|uniref:energy-coupling factor transporter transmembrane component T family protein n=1 Tax=Actinosynnema sp. NPDC059335 TaxID=3346804 RepID=UPI00366D5F3C
MSLSLYVRRRTPLHRLPAGWKFGALFVTGIALFLTDDAVVLGSAAAVAAALLASVRPPLATLRRQLAGLLVMLAVIFTATAVFQDVHAAVTSVCRLLALLLLALAVTSSTRASDVLEFFERLLTPLAGLGLANPAKISLGVSLVLRFVPEVSRRYHEIREAQAARGLRASPVALIVPLVVRVLKSADDIADAIDARCYPPPHPTGRETT